MADLDAIRPYRDDEVRGVLDRLIADSQFADVAARVLAPRLHRWLPPLARHLVGGRLASRLSGCRNVADVQLLVAEQLTRLEAETTDGLTHSGLDDLDRKGTFLFVGNHRDIALDSCFLNLVLHREGFDTCRIAVGDNLFTEDFAADLIRINKGFVVERGTTGAKDTLRALKQTSLMVRSSLEDHQSVWIAQREGRAKDGLDTTEPALLKMLMLAYRKEVGSIESYLARVHLIPFTVSYELDPCDVAKARELQSRSDHGAYEKAEGEDFANLGLGISGQKGRVHLHFGDRLQGAYDDAQAWAEAMDSAIARGARLYPTHRHAARTEGLDVAAASFCEGNDSALQAFRGKLKAAPDGLAPFITVQYANVVRQVLRYTT